MPMSARTVPLIVLLFFAPAESALAQPPHAGPLTVRIFPAPSFHTPAAPDRDRQQPIVGEVIAIDDVVLDLRARGTGRILHVPLAAIDRIERVRLHDPVIDSMKLLAATGGAWIGTATGGQRLFGKETPGAKLGAIALAGAAAWAAYSVVLHLNERERWEPVDLAGLRAALHTSSARPLSGRVP
jgi:hypothetical protein